MVRFGKRVVGLSLAVLLGIQALVPVSVSYAAYAVQDEEVRENTKEILKELNERKIQGSNGDEGNEGIHGDTASIDVTTKAIDKTTQKILEYVTRIWRQGEQQARSMEDVEGSEGNLTGDLSESSFGGMFKDLKWFSGSDVKDKYKQILGDLQNRDTELSKVIKSISDNTGWSGIQAKVKNELTNELAKLMQQTRHSDVFPELTNDDIQDLASGNSSVVMDDFFKNKFPDIPDTIKEEKEDVSKIWQSVNAQNDQIYDELTKMRKQTASARIALMGKMKESQDRMADYMKLLPVTEGEKQVKELEAMIKAENNLMQWYQLQMNMNYQQERSLAMQADERINRNIEIGNRLELSTGNALTEGFEDSYEAAKQENNWFVSSTGSN